MITFIIKQKTGYSRKLPPFSIKSLINDKPDTMKK